MQELREVRIRNSNQSFPVSMLLYLTILWASPLNSATAYEKLEHFHSVLLMNITNFFVKGEGGLFFCGLNPSPEFQVYKKVVPRMEGLHYNIARTSHATCEKSIFVPLV
jgi:hypothetical protein